MSWGKYLYVGLPLVFVVSCGASKTDLRRGPAGPTAQFKPTGGSTILRSSAQNGGFALTDAGSPAVTLVLDMAAPPARVHSWAPTACYVALPAAFVIGQATCIKGSHETATLIAAHARQTCSTNPGFFGRDIEPSAAIPTFVGCQAITISVKGYDPPLALTAVTK